MPEVPVVSGRRALTVAAPPTQGGEKTLSSQVAAVFGRDGVLARTLPDFEPRAGQVDMALAVARALERNDTLLAEAGTGTGKTLAYLIPAVLSRQRVLISTGTKNLQEQIISKDVPLVREVLGATFTATCMKGRANYVCLHRLDQIAGASSDPPARDGRPGLRGDRRSRRRRGRTDELAYDVFVGMIREWARHTETGDRAELEDLPEDLPVWHEVSATAETCLGSDCPRYDDCFVTRMRQRAAESDLVIVNHHLLCADAAIRKGNFGEVIPTFNHAILDEAHQLEDVATQYFGVSVSTYRIEDLARDAERLAAATGDAARGMTERLETIERLRRRARSFFVELAELVAASPARAHVAGASQVEGLDGWLGTGRSDTRVRLTGASCQALADSATELAGALARVDAAYRVASVSAPEGKGEAETDLAAIGRRACEIRDDLRFLIRASDSTHVYYAEIRGQGVFFRASPIDVSSILQEALFGRLKTTVLTSATLAVDEGFAYVRQRLGVRRSEEIRLPSEFDYATQALLYLPRWMPDPRSREFTNAAGREIVELVTRTKGRAFVLFTSYSALRAVQPLVECSVPYEILVQGTAPRSHLLRQFREIPNAVLLATSSFWQGVDVAGEALSCVIVDKLPFASPGDPITSARIEAIRERGGEPFTDYQVPLAMLALEQGLGRLIRRRQDRGILAVLDPRLRTKGYGRRFLAALPPAPIVHDLNAVERFLTIV